MIKKYLNEHHLNLYQCLSMWDFKKNNTITYLNLQDALKVGGFGIDKKIQKAILEYSLKYVIIISFSPILRRQATKNQEST